MQSYIACNLSIYSCKFCLVIGSKGEEKQTTALNELRHACDEFAFFFFASCVMLFFFFFKNVLDGLALDVPGETIGLSTATEISLRPKVGFNLREEIPHRCYIKIVMLLSLEPWHYSY